MESKLWMSPLISCKPKIKPLVLVIWNSKHIWNVARWERTEELSECFTHLSRTTVLCRGVPHTLNWITTSFQSKDTTGSEKLPHRHKPAVWIFPPWSPIEWLWDKELTCGSVWDATCVSEEKDPKGLWASCTKLGVQWQWQLSKHCPGKAAFPLCFHSLPHYPSLSKKSTFCSTTSHN